MSATCRIVIHKEHVNSKSVVSWWNQLTILSSNKKIFNMSQNDGIYLMNVRQARLFLGKQTKVKRGLLDHHLSLVGLTLKYEYLFVPKMMGHLFVVYDSQFLYIYCVALGKVVILSLRKQFSKTNL